MISYQFHDSGMFPRIFCDTCKNPIQDKNAVVLWNVKGEIAHVHIGACAAKFGKAHGWLYSDPLIVFVANLLSNTKLSPEVLKEADVYQDLFGVLADRKTFDPGGSQRE